MAYGEKNFSKKKKKKKAAMTAAKEMKKTSEPKSRMQMKTKRKKITDPNINPATGLYYRKPGGAEGNKPKKKY